MKSTVTVLGSTGSVGMSTLEVIARHPARYDVLALSAHTNVDYPDNDKQQAGEKNPAFGVSILAIQAH